FRIRERSAGLAQEHRSARPGRKKLASSRQPTFSACLNCGIRTTSKNMKRALFTAMVLTLAAGIRLFAAEDAKINTLTDAEKAAGWQLIFDGKDFNGWH